MTAGARRYVARRSHPLVRQPRHRRLLGLAAVCAVSAALSGCMAANPVRPVLSCTDCGALTYYGPQQPDPRVEMARVLTGGLSSVAGIVVGGDVLKSFGNGSGGTSTIERTTTTNNSVTDRSVTNNTVSDVSSTTAIGE